MNQLFSVLYEVDSDVTDYLSIKTLIVTDHPGNIVHAMNHRVSWHRHRMFSNFYDAVKFVEEHFDFEDLFEMGLEDVWKLELNRGYTK